jgi:hypothetical protein
MMADLGRRTHSRVVVVVIQVDLWTDAGRGLKAVTVADSGVGFNYDRLVAWLSHGLSKEQRGEGRGGAAMEPGRLGVFGCGSKEVRSVGGRGGGKEHHRMTQCRIQQLCVHGLEGQ